MATEDLELSNRVERRLAPLFQGGLPRRLEFYCPSPSSRIQMFRKRTGLA
jgi:hypothetical protein